MERSSFDGLYRFDDGVTEGVTERGEIRICSVLASALSLRAADRQKYCHTNATPPPGEKGDQIALNNRLPVHCRHLLSLRYRIVIPVAMRNVVTPCLLTTTSEHVQTTPSPKLDKRAQIQALSGCSTLYQRKPHVGNFSARNSGARNGCTNFMGAWDLSFFSLENPYAHKIPRFRGGVVGFFGGGWKCQFYFYGRGDVSEYRCLYLSPL